MTKKLKIFDKFMDNASKRLEDIYYELRLSFIREGWTEEDLKNPPYYPQDVMKNFQKFSEEQKRLFFESKGFFDIEWDEYIDYLMNRLQKIDKKTPLRGEND